MTSAPLRLWWIGLLAFVSLTALFDVSNGLKESCSSESEEGVCVIGQGKSKTASTVPLEYAKLCTLLREITTLKHALGLLSWDEQTMLPPGSINARGEQKAAVAGVIHEKSVSTELGDAISACEQAADALPDKYARANVRDARRDYDYTTRISKELAMEKEKAASAGLAAWKKARAENDFALFAPVLRKGLHVFKEYAATSRPHLDPYDAAVDMFERGMSAERLAEIFDELRSPLKSLMDRVNEAKENGPPTHEALRGGEGWDVELQKKLCRKIAELLTFDFNNGRMDVSAHPFAGGAGPHDVRITTRYGKEKPFESLIGTVHEVGHALYEQGRITENDGLPVSAALSMAAHESQSLFWERMVARGPDFWEVAAPLIHEQIPITKDATPDDFYRAVNQVNKSQLIRITSDEISYPFHIILRFEMERGLFNGTIDVDDIPTVWNAKMKEYFDVDVPDVSVGCLQDVHWPWLMFGYFPSYTLGAMAAAQLYAVMDAQTFPNIQARILAGKFAEIKQFLNRNFHQLGSLHESIDNLLIEVTGEPLKASYFIDYLESKYQKMYNLSGAKS